MLLLVHRLGFRVGDLGFWICGSGFWVWGLEFRVQEFQIQEFGPLGLGFRVGGWGLVYGVWGFLVHACTGARGHR